MLAQLIREAEQEHAGFTDPFKEHRQRPLSEHLDAWEKSLLAKVRTGPRAQRQVRQTVGRARLVFTGCGFQRLADITASRVSDFIARLRTDAPPTGNRKQRQRLSLQTLNYYLRSCKQFCRWAVRDRRTADNPLAHLQGWNARRDRTRRSRGRRLVEAQEPRKWLGRKSAASLSVPYSSRDSSRRRQSVHERGPETRKARRRRALRK
jgi:hypothetical protein